jgi:membrane-bound lytic murein transglycosylase A
MRLRGRLQGNKVVPYFLARRNHRQGKRASRARPALRRRRRRTLLPAGAGLRARAAARRQHGAPRLRRPERPSLSVDRPRAGRPRRDDTRPGLDGLDQGVGAGQSGAPRRVAERQPELRLLSRRTRPEQPRRRPERRPRRAADAERSIAVDPRHVPLGAPVFLATTRPDSTFRCVAWCWRRIPAARFVASCAPIFLGFRQRGRQPGRANETAGTDVGASAAGAAPK